MADEDRESERVYDEQYKQGGRVVARLGSSQPGEGTVSIMDNNMPVLRLNKDEARGLVIALQSAVEAIDRGKAAH